MQTTETLSQGLKREYQVVLAAAELAQKLDTQLAEHEGQGAHQRLPSRQGPGRPSQAPLWQVDHGRRRPAGGQRRPAQDSRRQQAAPRRPAQARFPAKIRPRWKRCSRRRATCLSSVAFEILPKFEVGSFEDVELERLVAEVPEEDVEKQLKQPGRAQPHLHGARGGRRGADGRQADDRFRRQHRRRGFRGRHAPRASIWCSAPAAFIPGFEDQLEGAKAGDERKVVVTFPENYQAAHLAGKEATFDVKVQSVVRAGRTRHRRRFRQELRLREPRQAARGDQGPNPGRLRPRLGRKAEARSARRPRQSLQLRTAAGHGRAEFSGIWEQVEGERGPTGKSFEDEGTTEEAQRAEYRRIAERRVRLGLVLAEVGEKAGVKVADDEVTRAIVERARQFPGQEKAVLGLLSEEPAGSRRNPGADLRAEGRRSHRVPGQGHRQDGVQGRTVQDRGRGQGRLRRIAPIRLTTPALRAGVLIRDADF